MKRRAQPWLGTLVEIAIADTAADAALARAFDEAFAQIARIHRLMNFLDPESDVLRINRSPAGETITVHPCTFEVLSAAQSISQASDGVFNIACASRLVEWGYLPKMEQCQAQALPQDLEAGALILESGNRVRKARDAWIDLGGIAKGYAVDLAVDALQKAGIRSGCVNAGGDLRAFGETVFPVGIRNPHQPSTMATRIDIRDEAVATSACYFSSKEIGGHAVSALLNGRSGQPVTGDRSVSVRAPGCMLADALTKVVAATGDLHHPALERFGASALII